MPACGGCVCCAACSARPQASWVWTELEKVRNVRPGFGAGLLPGLVHAFVDQILLRGKAAWTLRHK